MSSHFTTTSIDRTYDSPGKPGKQTKTRRTYLALFLTWAILVTSGVFIAMLYTERLKQQIAADIAKQTQEQLSVIKNDYETQVTRLKEDVAANMTALQSKVDSLNDLLIFAKDSANSKTDNSNLLYTRLNELRKQLDDLQRQLDVLQ